MAECVAGVGKDCQEPNNGVEALNTEYHFYVVASVVLVVAELPESSMERALRRIYYFRLSSRDRSSVHGRESHSKDSCDSPGGADG